MVSRIAGGTPAFQDRGHPACKKSNAGAKGSHSPQDRGRLACMRLYSTANERGLYLNRLFVCLSAKCRRDARDPLVLPAFILNFLLQKNCPFCPVKIIVTKNNYDCCILIKSYPLISKIYRLNFCERLQIFVKG
jgi:hypothetical protein